MEKMTNFKHNHAILIGLIAVLGISMAVFYTVKIIDINNNEVSFWSTFPNSNLHFYIYGDGYYTKKKSPKHDYPNSSLEGYTVNYFTIGDKELNEPPARVIQTPTLQQGNPYTPGIHGAGVPHGRNIDIKTSWNLTREYTSMAMIHFENELLNSPQNGCVVFNYNPNQIIIDTDYCSEFKVNNGTSNNNGNEALECFIPEGWSDDITFDPNSGKITWEYSNLKAGEDRVLYVPLFIAADTPANARIQFNAKLFFNCSGSPVASTSRSFRSSAYPHDPNYKVVTNVRELSHSEELSELYGESKQYVTYEIQFHNDGENFVKNVTVEDILPPEIEESSIVVLSSDHMVQLSGSTFYFENINLPGLEMGYDFEETISKFTFAACINEFIDPLECVTNEIDIYFDHLNPISASNTICAPEYIDHYISHGNPCSEKPETGGKTHNPNQDLAFEGPKTTSFEISPNPSYEVIDLLLPLDTNILSLSIYNAEGQLIRNKLSFDNEDKSLNISNFVNGLYFIVINTDNGPLTSKFIKI